MHVLAARPLPPSPHRMLPPQTNGLLALGLMLADDLFSYELRSTPDTLQIAINASSSLSK